MSPGWRQLSVIWGADGASPSPPLLVSGSTLVSSFTHRSQDRT